MRKTILAALVSAFVLTFVTTVRADLLDFYKTTDGVNYTRCVGAFSYTRTRITQEDDPDLDRLDIYLANVAAIAPSDSKLAALDGTWTALGGQMAVIQKYGTSTRSWYRYFDNDYTPDYINQGTVGSYVNFSYSGWNTSSDWVETGFGTPNINNTPYGYSLGTSVTGMWYTADSDDQLGNGDLLATFYVTPGAGFSFQASIQTRNGIDLTDGVAFVDSERNTNFGGYFGAYPIPEPSALLLAACGAIGLVGFARRGRRR